MRWRVCVSACMCALSLRLLKRLDILILFLRDRLEQGDKWTTVEELSHWGPCHVSPLKVEIKVLHLSVYVIYPPISHLFCPFLWIWCLYLVFTYLFFSLSLFPSRSLSLRWLVYWGVWQRRHYRESRAWVWWNSLYVCRTLGLVVTLGNCNKSHIWRIFSVM